MYKLTHAQYFDGLKEGKLLALHCRRCNAYTVPPKATCQGCGSMDLEAASLKGAGAIKTFTVVRVAPEGLDAPYVVVLVELEEGPWLMGMLEGVEPEEANMSLIRRKAKMAHKVVAGMKYTACEGVVPLFSILDADR